MNKKITTLLLSLMPLTAVAEPITIQADIWADNWFAFYIGEKLIKEDSVSINTERSFNKETFTFTAERPIQINMVVKDFKENDTGLEYIGTGRQQMGDGGLIVQMLDQQTNEILAVSSDQWLCKVIHQAPLDKSCEKSSSPDTDCQSDISAEPANWKSASFDDSDWPAAIEYSESAVSPKFGYDEVNWVSSAKLIWSSDLETDNTLLCRLTIQ